MEDENQTKRNGDITVCNRLPQEETPSNTGEHLLSSHTHAHTHTHTQPFSEGADNYNIARDDGGTSRQVHIHAELTIKHTSWEK